MMVVNDVWSAVQQYTVKGGILAVADSENLYNPCAAALFICLFFIHSKLELLTQFPALNDEKYLYFRHLIIYLTELFDLILPFQRGDYLNLEKYILTSVVVRF